MRWRTPDGPASGLDRSPMLTELSPAARGGLVARLAVLLSSALAVAACGAFGGADRPDLLEVVRLDGGAVAGGVDRDGETVVLARYDHPEDETGAKLLRLSSESGEVVAEHRLPVGIGSDGLVEHEGDLVFRAQSAVAELPAEDLSWPFSVTSREPEWLVVLDGDSFAPLTQYSLPPIDFYEPLVVLEGKYWALGSGPGLGYIDLATGETDLIPRQLGGSITNVRRVGDELLVVRDVSIRWYDLWSGGVTEHFFTGDSGNENALDELSPLHGFHYYEGEFWMRSLERDKFHLTYRYDLDARRLTDPRPADEFPAFSFETDSFRWELFRTNATTPLPVPGPDPEDGDVWKQVDKQTDEVIEEFDFGHYRPRFESEGYLWLTRDVDGGQQLARMVLS